MTPSLTVGADLPLTGERTVPGIARENYWFRRHEVAYKWVVKYFAAELRGAWIADAGCGEGYGAAQLGQHAGRRVIGLELDEIAATHADARYADHVQVVRSNLDALPLPTQALDALVSMQVVEHLWDLPSFLREVNRVLAVGGVCVLSTPNRLTFSPGLGRGEKPTNPFHVEEFDAEQLGARVSDAGIGAAKVWGLRHGPGLSKWERSNGSIVAAQVRAVLSEDPDAVWDDGLESFVGSVTCDDFVISTTELDTCADLIVVGRAVDSR